MILRNFIVCLVACSANFRHIKRNVTIIERYPLFHIEPDILTKYTKTQEPHQLTTVLDRCQLRVLVQIAQ